MQLAVDRAPSVKFAKCNEGYQDNLTAQKTIHARLEYYQTIGKKGVAG